MNECTPRCIPRRVLPWALLVVLAMGQGCEHGGPHPGGTADHGTAAPPLFAAEVAGPRGVDAGKPGVRDFGMAIASVGDVDGDGQEDAVVGACNAGPAGRVQAGVVLLLSGMDGRELRRIDGEVERLHLGAFLDASGDLDGDGWRDLLVGCPGPGPPDAGGDGSPGEVRVFSVRSGARLLTIAGGPGESGVGAGGAMVRDADGDGTADIALQAFARAEGAGPRPALVRLHSGGTGKPLWTWNTGSPEAPSALVGTGDLDGDGAGDLAVGIRAPGPGTGEPRDRVVLVSGREGTPLRFLDGAEPLGAFGASIAVPGDLDGDSVPDLVVSEPGAGRELPPKPPGEGGLGGPAPRPVPRGRVAAISGRDWRFLWEDRGSDVGKMFGYGLAAVGDADGDGVPDLAVGAPFEGVEENRWSPTGVVHVLSGRTGRRLLRLVGNEERGHFGMRIVHLARRGDPAAWRLLVSEPGDRLGLPGRSRGAAVAGFSLRGDPLFRCLEEELLGR
jgi:hypothetical protein